MWTQLTLQWWITCAYVQIEDSRELDCKPPPLSSSGTSYRISDSKAGTQYGEVKYPDQKIYQQR